MLQNAYFLAKIGADTAENEQHFAEILSKTGNYPGARHAVGLRAALAVLPEPSRCVDYLGSSGIKFEVEGGEGSPGADTYIPLHRKIAILQHFSETFRKMLYFGEIPKKFGQN